MLDNSGNIYVVGSTRSLDFQAPNAIQISLSAGSAQDGAIIKLGCTGGLRESEFMSEDLSVEKSLFSVHPNPFSSSFVVSLPEDKVYSLELIDSKGNKIFEQSSVMNATEILIGEMKQDYII